MIRNRRVVVAAAIVVSAVATPVAVDAMGGMSRPHPIDVLHEPVQESPRVVVARGADLGRPWRLETFESDAGQCLDLFWRDGPLERGTGGCGYGVPDEHQVSVAALQFHEGEAGTLIYGTTADEVATVDVLLVNGKTISVPTARAEGARGRYYMAAVSITRTGEQVVASVEAKSPDGRGIERRHIGDK